MFNLIQTELGIGDVICSLYAVESLSSEFPSEEINFFIPQHHEWANLADISNMQLKKYDSQQRIENAVYLYNGREDSVRCVLNIPIPPNGYFRRN